MTSKTNSATKQAPRKALNDIHRVTTLRDAQQRLLMLDEQHHLLPRPGGYAIRTAVQAVVDTAEAMRVDTIATLVTRQTDVLSALTGIPVERITTFLRAEDAAPLHRYRNVLALLVAVAELGTLTPDVPNALRHVVNLRPRTNDGRRACFDDEIAVMRVLAWADAQSAPRSVISAAAYALVDAGVLPGETPSLTRCDLDDPTTPTMVAAPGNAQVNDRIISLDGFAQRVVARLLDVRSDISDDASLTHTPRSTTQVSAATGTTSAAQVAAHNKVKRFVNEAGIAQPDLTPVSIALWRVQQTLDLVSPEAAVLLAGRKDLAQTYRALGLINAAPSRRYDVADTFLV